MVITALVLNVSYGDLMKFAAAAAIAISAFTIPLAGTSHAAAETSTTAPGQALVGKWSGVLHQGKGRYSRDVPVSIEVIEEISGLFLIDHDRIRGNGTPLPLMSEGGSWVARYPKLPAGATEIALTLAGDGHALSFAAKNDGPIARSNYVVTLTHDDPAARRFFAPRLDTDGRRVTDYSYVPPKQTDAGIPVSNAKAEGVDPAMLEKLVKAVLAESGDIDKPQTDGILILRNGKLIFEEYFWGQSANNPHEISSCTKSLTSILTGIAWDQGKVELDKPVASYFLDRLSSLWVREKYSVTVRNMLSMASGTDWDDSAASGQPSLLLVASNDIAGFMLDKKLVHQPGSKYNYDNGLPSLDGLLVERAVGEPYAQFADRVLFKPLGITNYSWVETRDHSRPLAAGGFVMRPLDAAKLGQLMLNGGTWQGQRIVSSAWIGESTSQQTRRGDYPYGFYWHLTNGDHRLVDRFDGYSAIGQGGQFIMVIPEQKLVIVITSSTWKSTPLTRDRGTPFGLVNEFVVPAIVSSP